ncbi:ATP-grasp domain-containing protein [Terriglobus sp.]|uniref:ATP-grasp domain-containing protein n=1 Tax=Terriglobus sp. TaxID=1889013 RepID=UPI003B00FA84
MTDRKPVMLCIASYEKGQAFLRTAAAKGCSVVLLTAERLRDGNWPRDALYEMHTMSDEASPAEVLRRVQYLARHLHIDRVVPLDEFDLEAAALVREELRLPGMGQTTTRNFRDKLAMRFAAQRAGLLVPPFSPVLNYDDLRVFLENTRGPWLLKPRTSASAVGIRVIQTAGELWRNLEELGEEQTKFLLECFIPGEVYHVDSICWSRNLLAQAVHRYGTPPMSLMHKGGVFTTQTVARSSMEARDLRAADAKLLPALGMVSGVTHSEFIRSESGNLYFLETAARVGGAFIAELIEFSTGVNPWMEWARIEVAMLRGEDYHLTNLREQYAGSVICLAKQEAPDLSAYHDPEVVFRIKQKHHAGLIVLSPSADRVRDLVGSYQHRFERDFCTSLPAPDKPTS